MLTRVNFHWHWTILTVKHNWFTLPTCSYIFVLWRGCIFFGNYIAWRFYSFMEHCGKRLSLNWLRPLPIWKEKSVSSLIKLHSFSKLPSILIKIDASQDLKAYTQMSYLSRWLFCIYQHEKYFKSFTNVTELDALSSESVYDESSSSLP